MTADEFSYFDLNGSFKIWHERLLGPAFIMSQRKDYSLIIRVDEEIVAKLKELNEPDEEIPFFDGLFIFIAKRPPWP